MKGVYRGLAPGSFPSHDQYYRKVLYYRPIAYWPLWEASGTVARCYVDTAQNGTYVGVTLGQSGIGDGRTAPLFDGVNDAVNIYSVPFAGAFDGDEGTISMWARVFNVGVWADGIARRLITFRADTNNRIHFTKQVAGDRLNFYRRAGGVPLDENHPYNNTAWFHVVMTWSRSAPPTGEQLYYLDGVQVGAMDVGLGAWAGALDANRVCIGVDFISTLGSPFYGWLAHPAIFDRALPPGAIADLAVV